MLKLGVANSTDLMIYKSSSNNLVLQTSTPLSNANGQTHRYRVTYNPTNGQMAVWRDGVAVLNWTDSTAPLTSGSYIALRTNKSVVKFDNLRITGNPATYSQLYYLYGDHLGSTSVMTTSAGQLVDRATYLPFGGYRRGDSSILTESGFTGHLHNDTLGLIYMNARFYSPATARFISADTIIPDPANPQSYNRYSYTYNNPLRFTDPTGHIVCEFQCPGEHILWNAMTGSAWYGEWDVEEQRANTATIESGAKFIGQTLLSLVFEPADWFFSASDAYQAYRQGEYTTVVAISAAAVLPFVTGSMGDEVVDAVGRYGDDAFEASGELLYRFNTGRDGSMFYGLREGEEAASFARASDFKSPAEAFETIMGHPPGSKDVYQVTTVGTAQGSGYYPVYDSLQNGMPFGHVSVYESVNMAGRYMPGVRSYNAFKEMFTPFGPPRPFEFE